MAANLVVDAALWWVVFVVPLPTPVTLIATALMLVWAHAFVTPQWVLARPIPRREKLVVAAAGLLLAAASLAAAILPGVLSGVLTLFIGEGLPGFLVGGAVAGLVAAAFARRFRATKGIVSLRRAALAAAPGPLIMFVGGAQVLPQGFSRAAITWFAAVLSAGLVGSLVTVPRWRSPLPTARLGLGLAAGLIVLVVVPAWLLWHRPDRPSNPDVQFGWRHAAEPILTA